MKPGSKKAGVLKALLERGAAGLNRFQAEKLCADHVLPSTIAELCRQYGLEIPRELESVPGHMGKPTEVSRYRLSDADVPKVRGLLNPAEAQAAEILGPAYVESAAKCDEAKRCWEAAVRAQEQELRDRAARRGLA